MTVAIPQVSHPPEWNEKLTSMPSGQLLSEYSFVIQIQRTTAHPALWASWQLAVEAEILRRME